MKAIPFTNTTKEDFHRKWDGEPYVVKAGQTMLLEGGMAYSFARRLAVRECNNKNLLPNKSNIEPRIKEYLADDSDVSFETSSKDKLNTEMAKLNDMKKAELVEYAKKNDVKVDPNAKKADIQAQIESEFEESPEENEAA